MSAGTERSRFCGVIGALLLVVCAAPSIRARDANDPRLQSFVPASGKAVVYVYRPAQRWGRDLTFWLSIDGRHIGNLPNGQVIRFEVDPGDHDVWATMNPLFTGRFVLTPVAAVAGQAYFVRAGFHGSRELISAVPDQRELLVCCTLAEPTRMAARLFQ
jgi:hypothetical protein